MYVIRGAKARRRSMASGIWGLTDGERELAAGLGDWLPRRAFDVHAHLYRRADLGPATKGLTADGPAEAGAAEWSRRMEELLGPGRAQGALFVGFPTVGVDIGRSNAFLVAQAEGMPGSRASLLVAP